MFVHAIPGLAPQVRRELANLPGVRVSDVGNDGRSDVILCEVTPGREADLLRLRTIEDAFVEVGRTLRSEGDRPTWIARRVVRPAQLTAGLELWRAGAGRQRARTAPLTYRVVTRVLQERTWRRTQLRHAAEQVVSKLRPRWRIADPAALEVWVLEYTRGRFVAGVRLTTARTRQHGGRAVERPGALRPTVAAAMVALGEPVDRRAQRVLLDPCCGSGTILVEAAPRVGRSRDATSTPPLWRQAVTTPLARGCCEETLVRSIFPTRRSTRACPTCPSAASTPCLVTPARGFARCWGRWRGSLALAGGLCSWYRTFHRTWSRPSYDDATGCGCGCSA